MSYFRMKLGILSLLLVGSYVQAGTEVAMMPRELGHFKLAHAGMFIYLATIHLSRALYTFPNASEFSLSAVIYVFMSFLLYNYTSTIHKHWLSQAQISRSFKFGNSLSSKIF